MLLMLPGNVLMLLEKWLVIVEVLQTLGEEINILRQYVNLPVSPSGYFYSPVKRMQILFGGFGQQEIKKWLLLLNMLVTIISLYLVKAAIHLCMVELFSLTRCGGCGETILKATFTNSIPIIKIEQVNKPFSKLEVRIYSNIKEPALLSDLCQALLLT